MRKVNNNSKVLLKEPGISIKLEELASEVQNCDGDRCLSESLDVWNSCFSLLQPFFNSVNGMAKTSGKIFSIPKAKWKSNGIIQPNARLLAYSKLYIGSNMQTNYNECVYSYNHVYCFSDYRSLKLVNNRSLFENKTSWQFKFDIKECAMC